MQTTYDAQVTAALFDSHGGAFALGDGSVRFESGQEAFPHDGAILSACVHPSGNGVVTGGDDGQVFWTTRDDCLRLAVSQGRWIDAVAASPASGLIAFAAGRDVTVLDVSDAVFQRVLTHERTVSDVVFDPKGRRVIASTYGGVALWFARIAEQKPSLVKWAGSHTAVTVSPDGAFVVTAMQDNQLHGWRLKDQKNLRMGGYPSKVRSFAWLSSGRLLATSGAQGVVLWPFVGANGPMGREATEIGYDETALVARVAASPDQGLVAAGLSDGRVWLADPAGHGLNILKSEKDAPISALALSADGRRVAWADEGGRAGVADA